MVAIRNSAKGAAFVPVQANADKGVAAMSADKAEAKAKADAVAARDAVINTELGALSAGIKAKDALANLAKAMDAAWPHWNKQNKGKLSPAVREFLKPVEAALETKAMSLGTDPARATSNFRARLKLAAAGLTTGGTAPKNGKRSKRDLRTRVSEELAKLVKAYEDADVADAEPVAALFDAIKAAMAQYLK